MIRANSNSAFSTWRNATASACCNATAASTPTRTARPNYHLRPSLWVEPTSDWGAGRVVLMEIPTTNELVRQPRWRCGNPPTHRNPATASNSPTASIGRWTRIRRKPAAMSSPPAAASRLASPNNAPSSSNSPAPPSARPVTFRSPPMSQAVGTGAEKIKIQGVTVQADARGALARHLPDHARRRRCQTRGNRPHRTALQPQTRRKFPH